MRSIRKTIKHQDYQNKVLFNSIDSYTMNMKVKGSDMTNLTINGDKTLSGTWNSVLQYDFNKKDFDTDQAEWTLCFNIIQTGMDQGEFNRGYISIEKEGHGDSSLTGQVFITEGMGKITKKVNINKDPLNRYNIEDYKILFYSDIPDKKLVVKDMVLVKGHYSHYIPYFKGTESLGPKIMIRNQNKNILRPEYLNTNMFYNGSTAVIDKTDTYVTYVVPTIQGTDYTITKKNLPDLKGHERMKITYYREKPQANTTPVHVEGTIQDTDEKASFTTPMGTTYTMIYLGYANNKPNYPVNRLVKDVQLEFGHKATKYIPHEEYTKIIELDKQLQHNDVLNYNKDYNRIVIEDITYKPAVTTDITKYYDINVKTFEGSNLIEVHDTSDHDEFLIGAISFDYETYTPKDAQHPNHTYILQSGDRIDISQYGNIDISHQKDGYIILKDGYNGEPDKTIITKEITKIIQN